MRLLSFDGGGIHSLLTLRLVERIERRRPGFLSKVDVFSGTSAGGINALVLASAAEPASMLEQCIEIWEEWPIFAHTPAQAVSGLLGFTPFYDNAALRQGLSGLFGTRTLRDLKHDIVIPSFSLDEHPRYPRLRRWEPVSFTTLETARREHRGLPLLDVALRTSAAPVNFPVYQNHVDGGFGANNPSMFALTEACAAWRRRTQTETNAGAFVREVVLVNVGAGRTVQYVDVEHQNVGWQFWLLDVRRPFLLLEAYVAGNEENVAYMCRGMLGDQQYLRVNADVPVTVPFASAPGAAQQLRALADAVDLEPALEWLDRNYFPEPSPAAASPPAQTEERPRRATPRGGTRRPAQGSR